MSDTTDDALDRVLELCDDLERNHTGANGLPSSLRDETVVNVIGRIRDAVKPRPA